MMTKESMRKRLDRLFFNGCDNPFDHLVEYRFDGNMPDAIQIDPEHFSVIDDLVFSLIDDYGDSYAVAVFSDTAVELLDWRKGEYASSNDDTVMGYKLKRIHDAFKEAPRVKGIPEYVMEWLTDNMRHIWNGNTDYNRERVEKALNNIGRFGVTWIDEARRIVCGDCAVHQSQTKDSNDGSNIILNTSDGYIVIDTPVKIFRSQAAMETYRQEHKEENTPALFVKDGEILCLQDTNLPKETKTSMETKPTQENTIDYAMKRDFGIGLGMVSRLFFGKG